jgi:hypothetical protein
MRAFKIAFALFLAALFITSGFLAFLGLATSASNDPNIAFYVYKNSASVNSGQVANTTRLFGSTLQYRPLLRARERSLPHWIHGHGLPNGGGGQEVTIQPGNIV